MEEQIVNDPIAFFSSFPQVRSCIFSWFSKPELLKCATVSKAWWLQVRSLMSNSKCLVHIRNCEEFGSFDDVVCSGGATLINGLSVDIISNHDCFRTFVASHPEAGLTYLTNLPLRYLHICVNTCTYQRRLLHHIVLKARESLEELRLNYLDYVYLLGGPLAVSFPNLRVLEVEPKFMAPWSDALKLISSAPNLQKVIGLADINYFEKLNEQQLRTFTGIYCLPFAHLDATFLKLANAEPKLTELYISDMEERVLPPIWSQKLVSLLEQCSITLKNLSVCAMELLKYRRRSGLSLLKLNFLELFFPEQAESWQCTHIITLLGLDALCPKLQSIRLNFSDNCYHRLPFNMIRQPPSSATVLNVRNVVLEDPPCTIHILRFCISQFSILTSVAFECLDCTELCTESRVDHPYEVCKVFTDIPQLKELKLCLVEAERTAETFLLDALLCGLTWEESEHLKLRSRSGDIALAGLQYCARRPPAQYAKNLRKLCVVIPPNYTYRSLSVTEVSGHLCARRLPSLKMAIESYCTSISEELSGMSTFCEIRYATDHKGWW